MVIQAVAKFFFHKQLHHQFDLLNNHTAARCLLWRYIAIAVRGG